MYKSGRLKVERKEKRKNVDPWILSSGTSENFQLQRRIRRQTRWGQGERKYWKTRDEKWRSGLLYLLSSISSLWRSAFYSIIIIECRLASVLFILLFSSFFLLFSLPLSLSFSLPFLCMYFSLNQPINKQSTQRANKRRRNNKSETRKICCNGHDLINVRCIAWSNGPRTMLKRVISQST